MGGLSFNSKLNIEPIVLYSITLTVVYPIHHRCRHMVAWVQILWYSAQLYSAAQMVCIDCRQVFPRPLYTYCTGPVGFYTDYNYTSPELYTTLYEKEINACSTVSVEYPKELEEERRDGLIYYDRTYFLHKIYFQ